MPYKEHRYRRGGFQCRDPEVLEADIRRTCTIERLQTSARMLERNSEAHAKHTPGNR